MESQYAYMIVWYTLHYSSLMPATTERAEGVSLLQRTSLSRTRGFRGEDRVDYEAKTNTYRTDTNDTGFEGDISDSSCMLDDEPELEICSKVTPMFILVAIDPALTISFVVNEPELVIKGVERVIPSSLEPQFEDEPVQMIDEFVVMEVTTTIIKVVPMDVPVITTSVVRSVTSFVEQCLWLLPQ
ncbi:uncharacterized protein A4U43_C08F19770 [Asparagus officinalis]|nr:uncharacterized protein A4U43_C08F19770 [Asparagus officinalis]